MTGTELRLGLVVTRDAIAAGDVVELYLDTADGAVRARRWKGPDTAAVQRTWDGVLLLDEPLTWSCMVCGDERPDALISVAHRKVAVLADVAPDARWNVRFCNDRADCTQIANSDGPWDGTPERCDPGAGTHVTPHRGCVLR